MASTMRAAAVGIRVKSGRAIAVVVTGSRESVEVRHRSTLVLSDPDDPATQQPYHAGFGQLEENPAVLRARIARVRRAAHASVRAMLRACRASALDITGAAWSSGARSIQTGSATPTSGRMHSRAACSERSLRNLWPPPASSRASSSSARRSRRQPSCPDQTTI